MSPTPAGVLTLLLHVGAAPVAAARGLTACIVRTLFLQPHCSLRADTVLSLMTMSPQRLWRK